MELFNKIAFLVMYLIEDVNIYRNHIIHNVIASLIKMKYEHLK